MVLPGDAFPPVPMPILMMGVEGAGSSFLMVRNEQRDLTILVVRYHLDPSHDTLAQIGVETKTLVDWAKLRGPFYAFGVDVQGLTAEQTAYAIKRVAVAAQGQSVAPRIVLPPVPFETLEKLYENGANAYFDALLVDAAEVAKTAKWLEEKDPAKKIYAIVKPQSPNPAYDLARAFADGATLALLTGVTEYDDYVALANLNKALAGDYAWDASSKTAVLDAKGNPLEMPVLTFVRGEDLRTLVIPRGDAAAPAIVALPGDRYTHPRVFDAKGDRDLADAGRKDGRFLLGMQPAKHPFAFTVDHVEKPQATREALDVQTRRGITVEEIIRNHQAYRSFQESIQPRYIAKNTTKLRFSIGDGGDAVEASIAGDFFSPAPGSATRSDWVWQDFYINGVKWKYGRIPELPLIQPEKVSQLPLDIHLTNEYRYQFVRETDLLGYHTYEVRFDPPPNAPEGLPLYRGTVWIDTHTWARVRISMIQLNLTGEVLSNEERVDFQPFRTGSYAPMTDAETAQSDPKAILWLPRDITAQQVISAAGRANVILRSTEFSNFRIDPQDFEQTLQQASASDARMVRETDAGMRYLEKRGGERVVKEGYDTSRLFMLGGIHHDAGLEYPVVPLGGVDYFNFNLANRGIQANVFFAGIVLAANATHPNVANTRTNVGADLFAIAVPVTNSVYRGGIERKDEAVKTMPLSLSVRAGHPFAQFGKVDVSLGIAHLTYKRGDETPDAFVLPESTFQLTPSIDAQYSRWGWSLSGFYNHSMRASWKPWGNLAEYSDDQKTFSTFGGSIGKSFYLPRFQRISADVNYLDGQNLDRFSKYELGFFGSQRVHGIRSGSVRAEKAVLGHLSYGFVFSDQLRLEAFYDHALIDDASAGYRREPFQGIGIAGQTVGPWATLMRLDIGKTIGRNAQNGFVANVVFLKLF
jgi:hypothetical protein